MSLMAARLAGLRQAKDPTEPYQSVSLILQRYENLAARFLFPAVCVISRNISLTNFDEKP
jgi:hypothetical protein